MFFFLFLALPIRAENGKVNLYFFWAYGCPHCANEKTFLESLGKKYPQLTINDYEVTGNKKNLELLKKIGQELSVNVSGVPFTVIGKQDFAGYYNDETTGKKIEEAVECAVRNGCEDLVVDLTTAGDQQPEQKTVLKSVRLPIIGELEIKNLSLPVLTFVLALLDGFNPCAMWILLFLISLLLGMKDRKRMWILGTAFIVASALAYFLFLTAWLNLFLFLGYVFYVRLGIGLLALAAGGYYLRDYQVNKKGGCKVMGDKKRQRVFEKLRNIAQKKQFLTALGGMILLAFAVNLIELICSAGLPTIYTKVLSLAKLPAWRYYLYLVFYIIIFMLDDLFVFFTAMTTLRAVGVQSKYSRFSHLIGGILMLIIGALLLFKPEWLMFG
ncbi:MAG: hypothetical protein JW991_01730 [Candidatus Pacebacteria bacterium]|nr:hypothetical protein [Candidatus Paceibacterota bacterium]